VISLNHEDISISTPEYVSLRFQSANLGSRAIAFIIDNIIIFIVQFIILILAGYAIGGIEGFFIASDSTLVIIAIVVLIFFVLNFGYYILFEYFNSGQTPGKRMAGIRVIQSNGHSITMLSSVIRNLLRLIDSLPTGYLIGILMIYFHREHKRLGDLVAGTIVVHERPSQKRTKIGREIARRNLPLPDISLSEATNRSITSKEWNLLKVYSQRFMTLKESERMRLTRDLAEVILPKFEMNPRAKPYVELEDTLLSLYILLKEEWDFE